MTTVRREATPDPPNAGLAGGILITTLGGSKTFFLEEDCSLLDAVFENYFAENLIYLYLCLPRGGLQMKRLT